MTVPENAMGEIQEILKRKEVELLRVLREFDGIAVERSADPMDEIQYASERDLAIGNVDRETTLLRNVQGALRRLRDGSFGTCIECESEISAKRLTAVQWALRCIECQNVADRQEKEQGYQTSENLAPAA